MDCREIEAFLEPYADGELGVSERATVEVHLEGCVGCRDRVADHHRYRQLLSRQPREAAPPELRARVVRAVRTRAMARALGPRVAGAAAAAVVLALVVGMTGPLRLWTARPTPPIVTELVGKHLAYSQIDAPAELASIDGEVVRAWFRHRLGVDVPVPDYTPAGIRLVGGRIADASGHKAAYLFYEKGHTLMSVFVVPGARLSPGWARTVTYGGFEYSAAELSGLRAVFWSDAGATFGLVSMLDTRSLLECADRLRMARAAEERV
jgi:anti-sigma factor (TIGR02949 family)